MTVSKSAEQALENESAVVTIDRRRSDRRKGTGKAASEEASSTPKPTTPRRKKQRRRHIDPTTCERDYSQDELEFMRAMDDYKCRSGRMFPTCSEVLEVVRDLGYVKLSAEDRTLLKLDETAAADEATADDPTPDEDA